MTATPQHDAGAPKNAEVGAPASARRGVDEWATYDEFAAGIDTYRLPSVSLAGLRIALTLDDGSALVAEFDEAHATWHASGALAEPGARDLIGMRNVYRYSPEHLYEHVYMSTERYAWQNLQGVQRGHGDMDLSTVWKLDDGMYLFCFREFRISVASVWLHDLGYRLRTTGVFLGLNGAGESEHSRAGGHIYPLGTVRYPDVQPV